MTAKMKGVGRGNNPASKKALRPDAMKGKKGSPRTTFKKGNKASPGRPARKVEEAYMQATMRGCSVDKWRRIIVKMGDMALEGKVGAASFLARAFGLDKGDVFTLLGMKVQVGVFTDEQRANAVAGILAAMGQGSVGQDFGGQAHGDRPLLGGPRIVNGTCEDATRPVADEGSQVASQ
jgi:hypothetical protein